MAAGGARAPKIWSLTTSETFTTFTNWKENLTYALSLDNRFAPLMEDGAIWEDGDAVDHGFIDDPVVVAVAADGDGAANNAGAANNVPRPQTAAQKVKLLHLMLGQVANYCNVIARHQILYESVSLESIWDMIREHFGFNVTGSRFLDLSSIRLQTGEKPADLYQRIVCFFTDNLFTRTSRLTHKGRDPVVDEKLTPTIQNTIVLLWLERIHTGLPGLVKQRYGTELRNKTLASIKPEIAAALDSMLEELNTAGEDSRVLRLQPPSRSSSYNNKNQYNRNRQFPQRRDYNNNSNSSNNANPKICSLCKTANIPGWDNHFLSQCKHISERDRRMMSSSASRVRQIEADYDDGDETEFEEHIEDACDTMDNSLFIDKPSPSCHRRVTTRKSPHMSAFYNHYPAQICLDTGSESSLVSERFARQSGIPILSQNVHQGAVQADTDSKLDVVGEVKNVTLRRGAHTFQLDALVTKQDVGDIIAGEPFLELNDIAVRSNKKQIIIRGNEIISYSNLTTNPKL